MSHRRKPLGALDMVVGLAFFGGAAMCCVLFGALVMAWTLGAEELTWALGWFLMPFLALFVFAAAAVVWLELGKANDDVEASGRGRQR